MKDLRDGHADPLQDNFLILNVIQTEVRLHRGPGAQRTSVYHTLDRRRLKCMKDAGRRKLLQLLMQLEEPGGPLEQAIVGHAL